MKTLPLLRVLALVFAGLAGVATAQTSPPLLRSGEHAGFTRFTLPLPPGVGWQLGRTEDGYGLRLSDPSLRVDDSAAFARIPRQRVTALRNDPGAVDLVFGCDCHARAFVEAGLLVIDIRDGAPPPGARFESRLGGPVAAAPPVRPAFDWIRAQFDPLAPPAPDWPATEGPASAPVVPLDLQDVARELLVQQFARASAQGLIGADLGALAPPMAPAAATEEPAEPEPRADPAPPDPLRNLLMDAETALDRAQRGLPRPGLQSDGGACLPDDLFDLAAWADERAPGVQIAAARRALLGEFDSPDPEAVLALARIYLHFGFGAEAGALLRALPVDLPSAAVLEPLAVMIDEALPQPQAPFAGMESCDGAVALWAVLAAPDQRLAPDTDRAALVRSFSALPVSLRRHLGPPLVQRLLAAQDTETAQHLRNAIGRAPGSDAPALVLIDAELAMARGAPEEASRTVAPAATGNAPGSPEALAVLVEARQAAGLPVDPATAGNVAALAQEHRGTPLGARLGRLEALELAAAGLFDEAFELRDRMRADGEQAAADRLASELLARVVEGADAQGLLVRLLAEDFWREGALAPQLRASLAVRLVEVGFPDLAQEALPPLDTASTGDRLLLSQAALAAGDARTALRSVAGLDGAQVDGLRASALLALGDHRAAAAAFEAAGQMDEALRAAWLGGDWETTARLGTGATAELAGRRAEGAAAPGDPSALPLPAASVSPDPGPAGGAPDGAGTDAAAAGGATPVSAEADGAALDGAGTDGSGPQAIAPSVAEDQLLGELAAARALNEASARTRDLLADFLSEHAAPERD